MRRRCRSGSGHDNSEIEDQHMGGGGEVYIGGAQQHWFGGNFNNATSTPVVIFGSQNSSMRVTNLGGEPKGKVYGTNTLINYGYGNDFSGTTAQAFGSGSGPWGGMQVGGRSPIPNQKRKRSLPVTRRRPSPASRAAW